MRWDVAAVWGPMQSEFFANQETIEAEGVKLLKQNPKKARQYLTEYSTKLGNRVVDRAWKLGDELWTKYDEKF